MWSNESFRHEVEAGMKLAHKYGRCLGAIEVALSFLEYNQPEEAHRYLEKFLTEIRSEPR